MNFTKLSLAKIGRFIGTGISHIMAALIAGVASIAAFLSLFLFENAWMKLAGCAGALVVGYFLMLGLALLRGER